MFYTILSNPSWRGTTHDLWNCPSPSYPSWLKSWKHGDSPPDHAPQLCARHWRPSDLCSPTSHPPPTGSRARPRDRDARPYEEPWNLPPAMRQCWKMSPGSLARLGWHFRWIGCRWTWGPPRLKTYANKCPNQTYNCIHGAKSDVLSLILMLGPSSRSKLP